MPNPSGWAKVGDLLGGDSELEYEKGLNLGANTENALSQASERRTKALAQQQLAGQLKAAGFSDADSDASAGALTAGANLGDVLAMKDKQQEYDFRSRAGDPNLPFDQRQIALQGVAPAPVSRFDTVGENMYQDKFSNEGPVTSDYGKANIKAKEATANRANAGGRPKIYMVGNVPYLQGADGSLERQLTPEEVANNFGVTEQGKGMGRNAAKADAALPAAFAKYRSTVTNADEVMKTVDDALKDVSWVSAGPLAGGSSTVPGTPAFKLAQAVLSIKANVGFQQLSQMRHESPTGGALGNVTEKELEFLQGAIASLNTAQNPADLAKALGKVRDQYVRYKDFAAQDYEIAQERAKFRPMGEPPANQAEPATAQPGPGNQPAAPSNPAGETRMLNGKKYVKVNGQWFEDDGT